MQKEILKALGENPRVAKELTTYLRGIGIDVNKFVLEDSLPNKLYHFINFFTSLYNIQFEIGAEYFRIKKEPITPVIMFRNAYSNYDEYVEALLKYTITYCEKPF